MCSEIDYSDSSDDDDEPEGWRPAELQGEADHDIRSQYSFKTNTSHTNHSHNSPNQNSHKQPNPNSHKHSSPSPQKNANQYQNQNNANNQNKSAQSLQNNNSNYNQCNAPNNKDQYHKYNDNASNYVANYDPHKYQKYIQNSHKKYDRNKDDSNNHKYKPNHNGHNAYNHKYPPIHHSMRHRNINGFNTGNYLPQTNQSKVTMTVRLPEDHISWQCLEEVDLLRLIKKLLPNNDHTWITYTALYQYLTYEFPDQYHSVPSLLNSRIFSEEKENYIARHGEIGTKDCRIRILNDRKLIPKEIGQVFEVRNGKYKAMTYDSRELDAECDSIEEAKQALLRQLDFNIELNWHSKFHRAFENFKFERQIFRSLEAELDCSEYSSLNDLYLLPKKLIDTLTNGTTFGQTRDLIQFSAWDKGYRTMVNLPNVGENGVGIIYAKICGALQRAEVIHRKCQRKRRRMGIFKARYPRAVVVSSNKIEIEVAMFECSKINGIKLGSVIEFECNKENKAFDIELRADPMPGFENYVDIIGMNDNSGVYYGKRPKPKRLNAQTLAEIICTELENHNSTFDMHKFPRMVERHLQIEFDPRKFGFETLRAIFEHSVIKQICRLDNASSTALVSTVEKSKQIPTMDFIKEGFERVLRKYDPYNRGYRMKKKGSKKTDIRAHFAQIMDKALKPKAWFGINVKDLILRCEDVIRVDDDTEADGVWLLFLRNP